MLSSRMDGALLRNWCFEPSKVPRWRYRARIAALLFRSQANPQFKAMKPVTPRSSWVVYFMFCPDGQIKAYQQQGNRVKE